MCSHQQILFHSPYDIPVHIISSTNHIPIPYCSICSCSNPQQLDFSYIPCIPMARPGQLPQEAIELVLCWYREGGAVSHRQEKRTEIHGFPLNNLHSWWIFHIYVNIDWKLQAKRSMDFPYFPYLSECLLEGKKLPDIFEGENVGRW